MRLPSRLPAGQGPTGDGRIKPDVTAPGVSVGAGGYGCSPGTISGTAASASLVAGTAALIRQYFAEGQ